MAQETCQCGAKSTSAVGPRDKMGRCRIWHLRKWSSRSCGCGSLPSSITSSRCKRAGADERAAPSSRFGEHGRHRRHLSSAAVREYTSEPVDRETLEFLVDAAIQAPSAVNQQPWSFAVVREQDVLDRISRESKRHMLGTLPAVAASDHFRKLLSD